MWQKPASEKDVWEECTFGNNLKSAWKAHQHWMPNAVFDCIFCLGKHPRETRKVCHSLACPKQREAWTEWVRGHQTPEGSCQSSNCCTVLQSLSADRLLNSNHGHQADKGFREQIFRSNLWLQRGIVPFFMRIKNPLLDQKHVSTQVHQRRHSNTSLKMLTSLFLIEEDSARRKFTSTKLPQTSMSTHRSTVSSRQHPKSGGSSCPPVFETPICRPFFFFLKYLEWKQGSQCMGRWPEGSVLTQGETANLKTRSKKNMSYQSANQTLGIRSVWRRAPRLAGKPQ